MKVSELIEILEGLDPDRIVLVSKDTEGNGYREIDEKSIDGKNVAFIHRDYSIEVGLERLTHALKSQGYGNEDVVDGVPAVVFY